MLLFFFFKFALNNHYILNLLIIATIIKPFQFKVFVVIVVRYISLNNE